MTKDELLGKEHQIDPVANWRLGHIERARGGCGYDVMEKVAAENWLAISSWGRDGWDLGEWPYVVIYARRRDGGLQVAYYCEGDVTVYGYPTKEEAFAAIDALAFFHWHARSESWVEGIERADDMPPHLCGPYSSQRAVVETEAVAS